MLKIPLRASAVVLACAAVAACTSLVAPTAARLAAMDPLTADPAVIEVALILPPGLRVAEQGATLTLAAQKGDRVETGQFILQERAVQVAGIKVPEGARAITLRIAPDDVARMRATQSRIAAWKAEASADTKGSLGVGLDACTTGGALPDDAVASILIRTEADAAFAPLVNGARLRDMLGPELFNAILPCEGAQ